MTNDDILTLAKAGFTAQQIAALSQVQNYPQNPQQPATIQPTQQMPIVAQPTQDPAAPAVQQSTNSVQVSAPAANPTTENQATVDDVLKAVNGLTSTFQSTMLQTAVQPKPVTAEDILAEIINPPLKTGGKN